MANCTVQMTAHIYGMQLASWIIRGMLFMGFSETHARRAGLSVVFMRTKVGEKHNSWCWLGGKDNAVH